MTRQTSAPVGSPAELALTLFGCGLDIAGFLLGAGLVVVAVASDPARVMTMGDGSSAASVADYLWCIGPAVIVMLCWSLSKWLVLLRFVAGFILGFVGAVFVLAVVLMGGRSLGVL